MAMGHFCADSPSRWASLAPSGPKSCRIPLLNMHFFKFSRNFATAQKYRHCFGAHARRGKAHSLDQAFVTSRARDGAVRFPQQRAGNMNFPMKSIFEIANVKSNPVFCGSSGPLRCTVSSKHAYNDHTMPLRQEHPGFARRFPHI
jgi:hypothetical protein